MPRPRPRPRRSQRRHLRVVANSTPDSAKVTPINVMATPVTDSAAPISIRKPQKPLSPFQKGFLCCMRLGVLGLGLGAIAGTALTTLDPTKFIVAGSPNSPEVTPDTVSSVEVNSVNAKAADRLYPQELWQTTSTWFTERIAALRPSLAAAADRASKTQNPVSLAAPIAPTSESSRLKEKLTQLAKAAPAEIKPYAYFLDTDSGEFVSLNGEAKLAAASTIKIPVAIAFFEAVDQGKIDLQEQLPLTKDVVGSGSGTMQYELDKKSGYSALETVTKMMVISDNTATNMVIKRLGGMETVNQRFQAWTMTQTQIHNPLPDLEGTNTTSPKDLATVLIKLQQGEILSLKSRDRLLNIMRQTKTRTLLPQGLESDAIIAHKTGDIGILLGDAGIVDMPNGKRYIGAVLATRPYNDVAARKLIQSISRTVYQHYKGITPPPTKSTQQKS